MAKKLYNGGKPRKKRAKSSYTTYKQHIRELEKKGYNIDKSEILTKKQFEYKFARFKAAGKKNITRDMAKDLVSYQYQRYSEYVGRWKKKGYALYDTLSKEEFKEFYSNAKKVESLKKRGVAYEIAEADLMFQPGFAKEYAPYLYNENQLQEAQEDYGDYDYDEDTGEVFGDFGDFYGPSVDDIRKESRREKREIKKIEEEILQGRYSGKDLFENFVKNNDGYYLDENGKQHIKKNVRDAFEAMY